MKGYELVLEDKWMWVKKYLETLSLSNYYKLEGLITSCSLSMLTEDLCNGYGLLYYK